MKATIKEMSKDPYLIVGLAIVVFYLVIGLLAPILAPPTSDSDPFMVPRDLEFLKSTSNPTPPSERHIFGTTVDQYDLYYGCIWGTLTAFRIGILATLGAIAIGLLIGTVAAHFGGFVDEALSWAMNIVLALSVILALLLTMCMPSATVILSVPVTLTHLDKLTLALILFGWPVSANIIRSGISHIRYNQHSREPGAVQAPKTQMRKKYLALILHAACLQMGIAVLFAAAVSYVGLGLPPFYADWGGLIQYSRVFTYQPASLIRYWHIHVFPGVFLFTFVLGWLLLGEGFNRLIERVQFKA